MNKITFVLLLAFVSLAPAGEARATVGGPTYISQIAFNAKESSVYYTVHDNGGRGCQPIIHSIDLTTLKDSEIKSCSQIEQEFPYVEGGAPGYNQFIADTYQGLPYLWSVSLEKNNINIGVELLSESNEENPWSEFIATLTQDSKEIAKINFRGCTKDQPHIFEGYMIPNSDAMAVLISNKGDCFEGGYVKESLRIIKGIKYYNSDVVRGFKEGSSTELNLGNIVAYAMSDDADGGNETSTAQKDLMSYILLLVSALFIGTAVGYLLGKRSQRGSYVDISNSPKQ